MVIAHELFDALPIHIIEVRSTHRHELILGAFSLENSTRMVRDIDWHESDNRSIFECLTRRFDSWSLWHKQVSIYTVKAVGGRRDAGRFVASLCQEFNSTWDAN
jgi:hypothetical protein